MAKRRACLRTRNTSRAANAANMGTDLASSRNIARAKAPRMPGVVTAICSTLSRAARGQGGALFACPPRENNGPGTRAGWRRGRKCFRLAASRERP